MFDHDQTGFSSEEALSTTDVAPAELYETDDPQNPHNLTHFHPHHDDTEKTCCIRLSEKSKHRAIWTWVDADLYPILTQGPKWQVLFSTSTWLTKRYARRDLRLTGDGKKETSLMHREVMRLMLQQDAALRHEKALEFKIPETCETDLLVELILGAGIVHHRNNNTLDNRRINLELVNDKANSLQSENVNPHGYPHVSQLSNGSFKFTLRKRLRNGQKQGRSRNGFTTAKEAGLGACIYLISHPGWMGLNGYTPVSKKLEELWFAALDLITLGETYKMGGLKQENLSEPLQRLLKEAQRARRENRLMNILERPDC